MGTAARARGGERDPIATGWTNSRPWSQYRVRDARAARTPRAACYVRHTARHTPHATHCFNIICLKFTAHKNIRLLWSHMFVTTCYKQCRQFLSLIYSYYTCIFIFVSTVIRLELLAQIKNNIVYLCVQHNYWIISKIFLIIIAMLHPE